MRQWSCGGQNGFWLIENKEGYDYGGSEKRKKGKWMKQFMDGSRNKYMSYIIVSLMLVKPKISQGSFVFPQCQYVIIDTDAGGDDAQTIVLAVAEAKRTNKVILGITCVDGNAQIDDVARNVLISTTIAGAPQIAIYKGARKGLTGSNFKDYYFSKDGLGTKQKFYIDKLKEQNNWDESVIREKGALEFLIQSANKYSHNLAIIAIGPLTNLALAYHLQNSFAEKIAMVSLMGGSVSAFGLRKFYAAEFNFHLDAEAAHIVTSVFRMVVMSTFDLSFDLDALKTLPLYTQERRTKAKFIHDIHSEILSTHKPGVCDPLSCIPVFSPELAKSIYRVKCKVDLTGQRTRGLLVIDWLDKSCDRNGQQIWALAKIDLERFIDSIDLSYN